MRYLRAEEILAIHDRIIGETGGRLGVRDFNLLFSVAERPKMTLMGSEIHRDVFSKAASYLEGLATYHVFIDGNKRTAFMTAAVFLGMNGCRLSVSTNAAHRFMLDVALKKKTIKQVSTWLKKYSK